jgi:hypothetical protein
MPYTSTGEASEHMAWNSINQQVGYEKVLGKEIGIPPMPLQEAEVVSLRAMHAEDMHQVQVAIVQKLHAMLFFADPMVKWVPVTLDPQVETVIRLDGRWHVALWLQAAGNINVVFPGMAAVNIPVTVGWNVLTCPDGTKLFAASRTPGYIRYANRGIAA